VELVFADDSTLKLGKHYLCELFQLINMFSLQLSKSAVHDKVLLNMFVYKHKNCVMSK
jgi:hypothetical protein